MLKKKSRKKGLGLVRVSLILFLSLFCILGGYREVMAETEGNYEYSVSAYDNSATIKRYIGSEKNLVIPKKLGGHPVNQISKAAFKGNTAIESVTIPEFITAVGWEAFMSCSALKTVKWNAAEDIPRYCFDSCISLESVELNDHVYWIHDRAFFLCGKLKSVRIGTEESRLMFISDLAFSECPNLTNITYAGRKVWWDEILSRTEETTRKRLETANVTYALKYAKPGKPTNVKVTYPDLENVHITWKAVPNARNYVVKISGPKGYTTENKNVWGFDSDGKPLKKPSLDIALYHGENWGSPKYPYGKYTFTIYATGYHTDVEPIQGKGSKTCIFKRLEKPESVIWKKYRKVGRKLAMSWKKNKLADGYILSYIYYKYGSENRSKEYTKALTAKTTSYSLTIPKKYNAIMFALRPYVVSGKKKCYAKEDLKWINIGPDGRELQW